ncbi:metalloregulator ArsR/SmtB family transcription factor [Chakrabartyella piscis]|uniref:ArsR/SmtB family transcription factor n=1 Tax=Chakrabartyella piscis TaxID=2918914 RepID=UPI002958B784|nr:metalloregulator ArsR/SmtB family transcription factor [Chakrabartyella piscis]
MSMEHMDMEQMQEKSKEIAELLKILANENRLLILCELAQEPRSVSYLLERLQITQSGISQHLAILKAHGILEYDKKAQTVIYKVKDQRILQLLETIKSTYCN